MGERSEPKRVCRRSALALFGYAAVFGLVASPAILMVSDAGAQTPPATPATPSTETPKSGTERRQERRAGRANGVRNDARGAQSDAKSGATVLPNRRRHPNDGKHPAFQPGPGSLTIGPARNDLVFPRNFAVGADRRRATATVIAAIDQHVADTNPHVTEGDFWRVVTINEKISCATTSVIPFDCRRIPQLP